MFDIFEENYREDLRDYLKKTNEALYAIWSVRHTENKDTLLLKELCENASLLDT